MIDTTECKLLAENDGTPGEREAIVKTGWMPISTAPQDGTLILVYRPDGCPRQPPTGIPRVGMDYKMELNGRQVWAKSNAWYQPTHWQPLPLPPEPTP